MADEVELPENRSWPAPPPFYKQFTEKNIERLKELRTSALGDTAKDKPVFDSESLQSIQVPDELQQLVPPEPPTNGKYRVFTELQDVRDLRIHTHWNMLIQYIDIRRQSLASR